MSQTSSQSHGSSGWPVWVILAAMIGTLVVVALEQPLPTPAIARITGRLTMEGRPLARHSVVFMEPFRGDLAFGATDDDGRFFIDSWKGGEMTPGEYRTYIVPPRVDPSHDEGPLMPNEYADQYRDISTTPLKYRIVIGDNRFDIDVPAKETKAQEPQKAVEVSPPGAE